MFCFSYFVDVVKVMKNLPQNGLWLYLHNSWKTYYKHKV